MEKVAIIRCEKNENTCPMTGCLQSLREKREGFAGYEDPQLVGLKKGMLRDPSGNAPLSACIPASPIKQFLLDIGQGKLVRGGF